MTRVAVAILNYNGEKLLQQFLPSVIANSREAKIIVIDNGSTDTSLLILEKQFPSVKVIALQENYGFCGGYNRGLKQVDATYVILLNSDIEVTPGWLDPMISILEKDASIAAAQPRILSFHDKNKFEYAGAGGGFIDQLGYPFCRGRLFDHLEEDHGQYGDSREVFWASGACLAVRTEVFRQFGGLDEDFFAHMEEIDLCWKINRANMKVYYCGSSIVYHVGAGTLSYESPRKTYLNFRNGLFLLFKHLDPTEVFFKMLLRIILDWLAALRFVFSGQFANAASVIRAHMSFLTNIAREYRKRRQIQEAYPHYSRANIYQGLIIVAYFLGGKKTLDVNNPR